MTLTLTPRRILAALLIALAALALGLALDRGAVAAGGSASPVARGSGETFPGGTTPPIAGVSYKHKTRTVAAGTQQGIGLKCPRGSVVLGGSSSWANPGGTPVNNPTFFNIEGKRFATFDATNAYDTDTEWDLTLVCGHLRR